MKRSSILSGLLSAVLMMPLCSCNENLADDPHYAVPKWLKGSAYEVLEKEKTHSIFLRAIDLSGYKPIVSGKSILTVMAPDDKAFDAYLQEEGYTDIDAMYASRPDEVKKMVGFHLLYYAFKWDNLVNFRPEEGDEATPEQRLLNAGSYYKFRTHSSDPIAWEWTGSDSVKVYHFERFIPVFNSHLFANKGIDPTYNYEYFFPESNWTGDSHEGQTNGFNVANASVKDNESVVTDNGYLYHIDKVLRPMETIHAELKNNPNYSEFFNLYEKYSDYQLNTELTTDFGQGSNIYLHGHTMRNIAWEWPSSNYKEMSVLSKVGYNIFAPSNQAINSFFSSFWTPGCGYGSLDELDPLIMRYFINQSFSSDDFVAFPEEIANGKVLTVFGTPINIDPEKVNWRQMCCNGTLYGMDEMTPPAIFSSVIGSAFRDRRYLPYLYALSGSNLVLALASNKSDFIALIPDTAQFRGADIHFETIAGGHELQVLSDDGTWVAMSEGSMRDMVNMNVSSQAAELKSSGLQIIETNLAFNYWYVVDGKITTSALFNKQLNPTYTDDIYFNFTPLPMDATHADWDNGKAYTYSCPSLFMPAGDGGLNHTLAVCNDSNYPYYLFSQLLVKAGLVEDQMLKVSVGDARFIAFVPTNDAIKSNIKNIPGCSKCSVSNSYVLSGSVNKAQLSAYLRSHFITSDLTPFGVYPYPGGATKGLFQTSGSHSINITDTGTTLEVNLVARDGTPGTPATLYNPERFHSLPFSYSDGAFHLINSIL